MYYEVTTNMGDGRLYSVHFQKHQIRKKPMDPEIFRQDTKNHGKVIMDSLQTTPISIQDAYKRMKEELERNPLYYNAWLKKLGDEVERCIGADFANEDIAKILSSLFKLPPMSYNDFEKFH